MNITDLIVEFIQQGNVVEIPGIGTLTSTNVSAHHDAESGTYYPSRRTVALNNSVSGNKAVVRRIAEKECVTNDIAEQMWNNFVAALDDKLNRNPEGHEFPGLGTLRRAGGKTAFEAVEGLDLDAGKKREQPIEHISTYTPKAAADPFAAFDKPADKPAEEPAPAPTEAPAPQPVEPEPQPEAPKQEHKGEDVVIAAATAATAAELSELKKQLDSLPSSQPDAKTQRRLAKEQARAEKEARKAEEEARKASERAAKEAKKAAERAAKEEKRSAKDAEKEKAEAVKLAAADEQKIQKEMERDRKKAEKAAAAEAHRALKEAKRQAKLDKKAGAGESDPAVAERKFKRRVFIIVILLLLLLIGCYVGYRLWRGHVPETKGTNNAKHVELPYYSRFSRDLNILEYDEDMIDANREKVDAFMSDYIREYLNARHYNNAYTVVMDRIDEYADERLHELMGEPQYAVQRFFPFDDYYRDYCYKELQGVGGYVNRCRVQGELMNAERLDQFLDALISELGLHPDGNRGMMGGNAGGNGNGNANARTNTNANQPEYVEVVPSAPTFKASKQGFDIIAGFCTQKSKADKMTNQLKSLGCDAYIINRSGLYYVSMGSAPSRTAAEALMAHIKTWYKGDVTIKNWNE